MDRFYHTLILLLLSTFLFSCESKEKDCEKFFPAERISQLSLENVGNYWNNDSIRNISEYITFSYDVDSNHIASIMYLSYGSKVLSVGVFSSKKSAIAAMEYRAKDVSAITLPEDSCHLEKYEWHWCSNSTLDTEEKSWYGQYGNFQRYIFINKWNTIIEAGNLNDNFSDSIKFLLVDAVLEVAQRVDDLSYCLDNH